MRTKLIIIYILVLLFSIIALIIFLIIKKSDIGVLNTVDTTFSLSYSPINSYLQEHGLTFTTSTSPGVNVNKCMPSFFPSSESTPQLCRDSTLLDATPFNDAFRLQWTKEALALATYLQTQGWHQDQTFKGDLSKLLNPPYNLTNRTENVLNFIKNSGSTTCSLTFHYSVETGTRYGVTGLSLVEDCDQDAPPQNI